MQRLIWIALSLSFLIPAGCRRSQEPPRAPLHGKITYNGNPVAFGTITFAPDFKKGSKGMFGTAEIQNGEYRTDPDFGITEGPMMLHVQIFDAKPPANKMIANIVDYPLNVAGASTQDLALTANDIKPIRP